MKLFNFLLFKYLRTSGFTKKSEGLVFFCALMFFLFQCHFLTAQRLQDANNSQLGLISINNGATVYSDDKGFNQQVKDGKIVVSKTGSPILGEKNFVIKSQVGNGNINKKIDFSEQLNSEIPKNSIDQPQLISLINGAKIYSKDKDFNQQIENKKIVFNNALISGVDISDKNYLIIASKKNSPEKFQTLEVQVKNNKENKKIDLLRKVKKEISEYEKKKKDFIADRLECCPSSEHFSSAQKRNAEYINYRTDRKDYSKIFFLENFYSVKKALNFLYTYNDTHDNNKSLDYCFSEVFSVRPPPVLV